MNSELAEIIMHTSNLVLVIILLLALLSIYSWAIILEKSFTLFKINRHIKTAETSNLIKIQLTNNELTSNFKKMNLNNNSAMKILQKIYQKHLILNNSNLHNNRTEAITSLRNYQNLLIKQYEIITSKSHANLQAIASISPFIGLLGTVIGIINCLSALGNFQQITLNQIAPGAAEALFATGLGLLVAIPASLGSILIANKIDELMARLDCVTEKFCLDLAELPNPIKEV